MSSIFLKFKYSILAVGLVALAGCTAPQLGGKSEVENGWNGHDWGTPISDILNESERKSNFNFDLSDSCTAIISGPLAQIGNAKVSPWPIFKNDQLNGVSYRGIGSTYTEDQLLNVSSALIERFGYPSATKDNTQAWKLDGLSIYYIKIPNGRETLFRVDITSQDC